MKITLTLNEVLVLISEGMTMNNCQSLANKLRDADKPVQRVDTVSVVEYNDVLVQLDKAKQTEIKLWDELSEKGLRCNRLESKIRALENEAKQDDESLKYFRKWVEELRVATGYDEGVTPATVFSNSIELVRQHNELCKRASEIESKLVKANDVIAEVKASYDFNTFKEDQVRMIRNAVEEYYRGN